MTIILKREEFRKLVFERDNYKCVLCGNKAIDAHHIIERRLWDDGGYYLSNGASLCSIHHIYAEESIIDPEFIRRKAKIMDIKLPSEFNKKYIYDKWGKIKYPRTPHLPWSSGTTSDDRVLDSVDHFINKHVVVTEKMDGENSTVYTGGVTHARSLDSKSHPSRNWFKKYVNTFAYDIPNGWRICGENLYAKHSIHYKDLSSYFLVFSIWDENNMCLSWSDTVDWCLLLGLKHVPAIYKGIWDIKEVENHYYLHKVNPDTVDDIEGYVVRLSSSFHYDDFDMSVAKFVRTNHVQVDDDHWMFKEVVPNELKTTKI